MADQSGESGSRSKSLPKKIADKTHGHDSSSSDSDDDKPSPVESRIEKISDKTHGHNSSSSDSDDDKPSPVESRIEKISDKTRGLNSSPSDSVDHKPSPVESRTEKIACKIRGLNSSPSDFCDPSPSDSVDHKPSPVESRMVKIAYKTRGLNASPSDSVDHKPSPVDAATCRIYRIVGREKPVQKVLGGGKPRRSKTIQKGGTASCISQTSIKLGQSFSFQEILDATNKFDESLLLGVGGFGRVYKGTLEDGTTKVAVKRRNRGSLQDLVEFKAEIAMVSEFCHRHLVSFIGYCDENSEMILVYEYMANGTLSTHLNGRDVRPLSWKQRLKICIGAARGLHYLHTGAPQSIIHRDVKTTNILLDDNFVAKVSDFGISKIVRALDQTHVSAAVKGTHGYFDPEYIKKNKLTMKSDVYSFGVVLMEVLCNRPAVDHFLPEEQINLVEWAMSCQQKGKLDQIMDPNLVGKVNRASLKKFKEIALKCLAECGDKRPSMEYVLCNLEQALKLEEIEPTLFTKWRCCTFDIRIFSS